MAVAWNHSGPNEIKFRTRHLLTFNTDNSSLDTDRFVYVWATEYALSVLIRKGDNVLPWFRYISISTKHYKFVDLIKAQSDVTCVTYFICSD